MVPKTCVKWRNILSSGTKHEWLKLHATVTTVLKTVPSLEVTDGEAYDSPQLGALLESLPLDDLETVTLDARYLSWRNYDLIAAIGAKPYIRLKENLTNLRGHGPRARRNMMFEWIENPNARNKKHHVRSSAETTFSAIKRRFGYRLASIRSAYNWSLIVFSLFSFNEGFS